MAPVVVPTTHENLGALAHTGREHPFGTDSGRMSLVEWCLAPTSPDRRPRIYRHRPHWPGPWPGRRVLWGSTDQILMRVVDVLLAFPGILLAMAIVSSGPGLTNVMLAVGIWSRRSLPVLSVALYSCSKNRNSSSPSGP